MVLALDRGTARSSGRATDRPDRSTVPRAPRPAPAPRRRRAPLPGAAPRASAPSGRCGAGFLAAAPVPPASRRSGRDALRCPATASARRARRHSDRRSATAAGRLHHAPACTAVPSNCSRSRTAMATASRSRQKPRSTDRRITGEHSQGDLDSVDDNARPSSAPRLSRTSTTSPRLGMEIGDVGAVDPRMAGAHAIRPPSGKARRSAGAARYQKLT